MTDTSRRSRPSAGYPEFPPTLSEEELGIYFHLDERDRRLVNEKRRSHNRLGYALQVTIPRFLGRFLPDPRKVPAYVVTHVGEQLDIDDPQAVLQQYGERDGTARTHAAEIRDVYGWSNFTDHKDDLAEELADHTWETDEGPQALLVFAVTWLRTRQILLPDLTPLHDLIAATRRAAEDRMYEKLGDALTDGQRSRLDVLLHSTTSNATFDRMRKTPDQATWKSLTTALERAASVRDLGFTDVDVSEVPRRRLAHLARYGLKAHPARRKGLSRDRQRAIMLATVKVLESTALDDALDILNTLITNDFLGKSRRKSNKQKLASYAELERAAARLLAFVRAVREAADEQVDTTTGEITEPLGDSPSLRDLLDALAHRPGLTPDLDDAIETVARLVPTLDSDAHEARRTAMLEHFDTLKAHMPTVIENVAFDAAPEARPVLRAFRLLPALLSRGSVEKGDVDDSLLIGSWRKLVMQSPHVPSGAVDAKAYAFCVVEAFHQHLRDREIFAKGAKKWGNPAAGRLADDIWQRKKTSLLHSVGLPEDPTAHLAELEARLDAKLRRVASRLPQDSHVELGPGAHLLFHKLPASPMPASLRRLRSDIARRMPKGDLPEILLEVFKWTNGRKAFTSLSGAPGRGSDLATTLSAVLVAHGCNVGFEPVTGNGKGLGIDQIDHADREYCRPDNYAAFNTLLLDMQDQIDLARQWGGGQLASVDGMNFVVPRTLFPARLSTDGIPEITWLTMISDQATQLTGKVVTGTADRCLYVLDTIYEHHTRLDNKSRAASTQGDAPTAITGETGDHEDIAFSLLSLSGYAYAPTPAHLARTKLWRIDPTADYGPLQKATQARIDLELIKRNWDDILRLVCSVHSGTVRAQDALRQLIRKGRMTSLGQAIAQYGLIMKTTHLLDLFDDPDFRRKVETQSEIHAARHRLAGKIFHGNGGQVHRYHQGMEDQLGALGLVLNAIVLFNTFYMDQIIMRMRERGLPVFPQDVAQLSPFIYQHINMKGRYAFELPELPDGMMRALHDPEDMDTDDTDG